MKAALFCLVFIIFMVSFVTKENFKILAYNTTNIPNDKTNMFDDETIQINNILKTFTNTSLVNNSTLENLQVVPDVLANSFPLLTMFKEITLETLSNAFNSTEVFKGKIKVIKEPGIYNIAFKDLTSTSRIYYFKIDIQHEKKNFVRTFEVILFVPDISQILTDTGNFVSGSLLYNIKQNIKIVRINTLELQNQHLTYKPNSEIPYQNLYQIQNKLGLFDPIKDKYILKVSTPSSNAPSPINGMCTNQLYTTREECVTNGESWDIPPRTSEECPFYKSNKNYPNQFGKLIDGNCELPLNMKRLTYRYYSLQPEHAPLCYNCKQSNKLLDYCCNDQNNLSKYPNLKSPDYAFENDLNVRNKYNL